MTEISILNSGNLLSAGIALNQKMFPVLLGLLLTASAAWIFLSNRLYGSLKQNHPKLHEALGSPQSFMHMNKSTNFRVFRFLYKREYESIDDPAVKQLCRGLRSLMYLYAACLAGCLILLFDKIGLI